MPHILIYLILLYFVSKNLNLPIDTYITKYVSLFDQISSNKYFIFYVNN